jgi:hypothetical protein
MMNMTALIDKPLDVHIQLKDRMFVANLEDELSIDTEDLVGEFLTHTAKIAMWSVLHKLSQHKVDMLKGGRRGSEELEVACQNRDFLAEALEAFNHRKSTLIKLCTNPQDDEALVEYHKLLKHMGVLRSQTV